MADSIDRHTTRERGDAGADLERRGNGRGRGGECEEAKCGDAHMRGVLYGGRSVGDALKGLVERPLTTE